MVHGVGSGGTFGAGEKQCSACLKAKASPRGGPPTEGQRALLWVDLLQRATSVPLLFLWEARPRGEGELSARSRAKASPRGRGSHRRSKALLVGGSSTAGDIRAAFVLWEARPRGEGELSARSRPKASPRVGAPTEGQKPCSGVLPPAEGGIRAAFFVGGATSRRRRAFCPLKSKSFAPGRASHRRSKALLWVMTAGSGRAAL